MGTLSDGMSHIMIRSVDFFKEDSTSDRWLFREPPTFWIIGVTIPILGLIGISGNLLTCLVFQHKDLRSSTTLILKACLMTDSVYLLTAVLTLSPKVWIHKLYSHANYDEFWEVLSNIQEIYMVCYPICQIVRVLSVSYSMFLILEQTAVFLIPDKLSRWMENNASLKLVITLLNLLILCHLITFFKFHERQVFVIQPVGNSTKRFLTDQICLSVIYNSESYQHLERYIFFVLFELLTWLVTLVAFIICVTQYIKNNNSFSVIHIVDNKWLRHFRSGRSLRTNLSLTGTFLVIKFVAITLYIMMVPQMQYDLSTPNCYLTPMDTRFLKVSIHEGSAYIISNVLVGCYKPWVCIVTSFDMKNVLVNCCSKTATKARQVGGRVFIVLDPFRHSAQEVDLRNSQTVHSQATEHF